MPRYKGLTYQKLTAGSAFILMIRTSAPGISSRYLIMKLLASIFYMRKEGDELWQVRRVL